MAEAGNHASSAAQDDLVVERSPLTREPRPGTRPPSWRKRSAQIGLVALAVIVAVALFWNANRFISQQTPTQPATLLTPITALVVSDLTDATITLNGKRLAGHPPMIVSAYMERDDITVSAPLFNPHTCHYQGLQTASDTIHCLFAEDNDPNPTAPEFVIGAFLTPEDLVPSQQAQVTLTVTQQMAQPQQTPVQPGEYIATTFPNAQDEITSQHATAPLVATATFVEGLPAPAPAPTPEPFMPPCSALFCPAGFGSSGVLPTGQVWELGLNVMLRWQFTDGAGNSVGTLVYPSGGVIEFQPTFPGVQFAYNGFGWYLAEGTDLQATLQSALCENGVALLQARFPASLTATSLQTSYSSEAGCLITLADAEHGSNTFLWRFGVLLAADAGAHKLAPDLPMAPAAELAAAEAGAA